MEGSDGATGYMSRIAVVSLRSSTDSVTAHMRGVKVIGGERRWSLDQEKKVTGTQHHFSAMP